MAATTGCYRTQTGALDRRDWHLAAIHYSLIAP